MRHAMIAAAALAALACSTTAASAQVRGSFLATCEDIRQRGPIVSALCETVDGRLRPTRIDLRECASPRLSNINGRLACSGSRRFQREFEEFDEEPRRPRFREQPGVTFGPVYRY